LKVFCFFFSRKKRFLNAMTRHRREKSTLITMGSYSLTKKGVERFDWADPYRVAVGLSWPSFLGVVTLTYATIAALFATALMIAPGAVANARSLHFSDFFFFSVETLSTVGYGELYPASFLGHSIASAEMLTGAVFTALLTGLTFARFSKPRAKFLFADHPIATTHDGQRTLMLRVGNGRATVLSDAKAKLSVLISEQSQEGQTFRRTHQLHLVRDTLPVFPLTWTLMHKVDEASPMFGIAPEEARKADARLFVSLEARDPDLSSIVHDLRSYGPEDILFDMRYVDVISVDGNGKPVADMTKLSEVEPEGSRP